MELFVLIVFGAWLLLTLFIKAPIVVTIPKFWYEGITLGWLIILRRESYSDRLVAHEYIHFKQQKETLIIFGYILYFTEFVCKSIYYRSFLRGYQNISFEREATLMSGASSYVLDRKPFIFRHFIFMDSIATVSVDSPRSEHLKVFKIGRGGVFKCVGNHTTAIKMLNFSIPKGQKFKILKVKKGTSLYQVYGDNTFVVLENTMLPKG
jgi:hypothetical protein